MVTIRADSIKRILMITDTFPPHVGGGGTIRMVKFAKYFSLKKWKVTILTTTAKRTAAGEDKELLKEISSNYIQIHRVGTTILNFGERLKNILGKRGGKLDINKTKKRRNLIAALLAIPDSLNICILTMVWAGLRLIRKEKINFIIASSPSFSILVVGYFLKMISGKHFIVDIRDDWAGSPAHSYDFNFRKIIDLFLERKVMRLADMIIATSTGIKKSLLEKHPMIPGEKIRIVFNGFDPQDFEIKSSINKNSEKFIISYLGVLNYVKTPQYIFEGLKEAIQREPEIGNYIKLRLVGKRHSWVKKLVKEENLEDFVEFTGFVSHKKSIQYMLTSDILVLILFKEEGGDTAVPGKLYEYLAARKPILACVCEGETRKFVIQQRVGKVTSPKGIDSIVNAIIEFYQEWRKGELKKYSMSSSLLGQYSREKAVIGLIDLLTKME